MDFLTGAAQAGNESAKAATRMSPRDRTRNVIEPPFPPFEFGAGALTGCMRPALQVRVRSQPHARRELLPIRYGRSQVEMDSKIEKKNFTKESIWPRFAMRSCGPNAAGSA